MSSAQLSSSSKRSSKRTSRKSRKTKSSSMDVSSMEQELKELRQWKINTDKLLSKIDSQMDTLNNNVMDELDNKDKMIKTFSKDLEKVKRNFKNMGKGVDKTKQDINNLNEKVHDSTINIDRMTYVMNVVKYILKQELNVDLTPYHIDAHRPNVTADALPRSTFYNARV